MNNIAWVVVLIGVIVLCYGVYMLLKGIDKDYD